MRHFRIPALVALLGSVIALPAHAGMPEIKVGVAAPLTGALAKMGADIRNGAQLAVDEANARGGVLGAKVLLVVGDDKGDPREGITVANKLVQSGVLGVTGHLNSGISIPASKEVYNPARVVEITPASTNPSYTERHLPNTFRTIGRDDQQGKDAAAFALGHGYKTAAILNNKNAYGQGLAEVFRKNFEQGGGKVLMFDTITSGDKDFTPILTRVKAKEPALLFFGGEYQDGGLLCKQARRVGLKAPLMGGDGLFDGTFCTLAGDKAAEGSLITFPGGGFEAGFEKAYTARFGAPGAYSGYSYDATRILLDAIKRAGKPDRAAVLAQVGKTRGFKGATGTITFDAKGDRQGFRFSVWKVSGGKFKLVP